MVLRRLLALTALICAGEAIFLLPFVVARVFRPTLLDVFQITNLQLGTAFSAYGVVAMISYFFGGPLADRFPPRLLITLALVATSAGGLVMASIPTVAVLTLLFGYWGLTTILLFWAALIRATRAWGSRSQQGAAFGLLDGGRGLVAALIGSGAVVLFALALPDGVEAITEPQRREALRQVILLCTAATFAVAVFVWLVLPPDGQQGKVNREAPPWAGLRRVVALPQVWLQAVIIVCAYVGYKGLDDVSLYARDVLRMDELDAARVGALALWVRPVAAIAAGVVADRVGVSRMILVSFALLVLGSGALASDWLKPGLAWPFFYVVVTASLGIFALRGLYYAVMQESRIPFAFTGAAVGLVSVLGYTPDVFMGPLMGYLLDSSPGPEGHRHVFAVIGGFAAVGLAATLGLRRVNRPVLVPA